VRHHGEDEMAVARRRMRALFELMRKLGVERWQGPAR
jgi:hypothetical protein